MAQQSTRRTVLGGVGTGIAALAGCLGDDDPSGDGTEAITVARSEASQDGEWQPYGGVVPYYTNIFEPLVGTTQEMEPAPVLATDWERENESTWRFDLREDVTFHDGSVFTADAVVSTFDTLINHWDATGWINVDTGGVTAVDDHTVEFETTEPFPALPGTISHDYFGIIHPDTDEDAGVVLGTGPFQFVNRDGHDVTVEPYEDHWDSTPTTERLAFNVVDDGTTRTTALESGDVDLAIDPPQSDVGRLEDDPETAVETQRTPRTCFGGVNIYKEPTDDEMLRRALCYAVNQEQLVETVLEGVGDPARGPISPEIPWAAHDELPGMGPDRDRARELVAESSYDGETLTILIDGSEPDDRAVAEILQNWFEEINVESEIRSVESAAFYETFTDGEAHVSIVAFGSNSAASDYLIRAVFHSEGSDNQQLYESEGTGIMNLGSEVDDLIEGGYLAESADQKADLYGEVQERVVEQGVVIPLYYLEYTLARRASLPAPELHPIDKHTDFTELERGE
ncbi:ABC transporter substrate-binding protein [Natronococcus sp. A-GB7]|uniref:ABC transporter substrate-binding protein n=1 Tax=Natronococcus sp. A-GB7 TaxID=3037649 RepID=UPI00241F457F|nr:ABC transporter substrate-binding protein [Natronococcus sp. A-GB7]MDG5821746.1 ABC transporter substrate-binding protein [Natronococcus sp. A-GB7]